MTNYVKKKKFKSIANIKEETFDCGDTIYATKFLQSLENVANYLQQNTMFEGPNIGKVVREME